MRVNERKSTIIELMGDRQQISIRELASHFGVSDMTIRRDLTELQKQGVLVRTHGGGKLAKAPQPTRPSLNDESQTSADMDIGKLAASLIKPRQTIMVDCEPSVLDLINHIPRNIEITIVTTSLHVVHELQGSSIDVILLGGLLRKEFPGVYGPLTETLLNNLHADILFAGCDGASSEDGFYMADMGVSSLEQSMIRASEQVVVVTESSKFGHRSFARFATPRDVHIVVTDSELSVFDRFNLEEQGVELMIAGATE